MSLLELFIVAVGLSMDAFAVAICKGLALKHINLRKAIIVGLYFGIFQAGMPLIGYALGKQFQEKITAFDHWIAFVLLSFIGVSMILESRKTSCEVNISDSDSKGNASLSVKNMTLLAIATSIDALAIGVTFAFLRVNIVPAVSFIGIITFVLSMAGVRIGYVFGSKFKSSAEFAGGLILILMGFNILLEHLGIFKFG